MFSFSLASALSLITGWEERTLAQSRIVPDSTLGAESSQVVPNFNGLPIEVINGGAIRGSNLFHSFEEFNVAEGRVAYFFSPTTSIQNILARVTGSNPSQIMGMLGIFGNSNPNLFLINPNGIIFGSDASLDVGGSFVATTANAIAFNNQGFFNASVPNLPPLLTVNPSAFLFNQIAAGTITNQSVEGLKVPNGRSLLLLGGEVKLEGGVLVAPGGRVELGGMAGTGTVGLNVDGNNLNSSFPDGETLADISLTKGTSVDVTAGGGGSIVINAQNLSMAQGSALLAGIGPGLGSSSAIAGNVDIHATGAINLTDESVIYNLVSGRARGKGGDINLTTSQLFVSNGSQLGTITFSGGAGGSLTVNASSDVQLRGTSADGRFPSGLFTYNANTGDAGNLTITTDKLLVSGGAQLGAYTSGAGNGGNLTVNASSGVQVIGRSANDRAGSRLFAQTEPNSSGKAGDLTINTDTLLVRDGAQVSVSTFGTGNGGNLTVNASSGVQLIGTSINGRVKSGLFAEANSGSSGKAGDLTIHTDTLLVRDGAQISASTFSTGNGGNLTVNASSGVQLIGISADGSASRLSVQAYSGSSGNAGDLTINTGTLLARDGAVVIASTFGQGNGGNITVNASSGVQLIGNSADGQVSSGLFAQAEEDSSGKAGDLTIHTDTLLVRDGAQISASTFSTGNGGNLTVNSSQSVQLIGTTTDGRFPSGLYTSTQGKGDGGNLRLTTQQLRLSDGAVVSARTISSGKGGSLAINASDWLQLSGAGGFFVNATTGSTAGNLTVETKQMFISDGAQVTVSSPSGQAGNMTIQANSLLLNRGRLFAETAKSSAEGGANITLNGLDLLRMDNESLISANALENANGGNITIDSTFIVAMPPTGSNGSDITANAVRGNGGRVNVTSQGLFGIQFRPQLTPKNDITVSSEFGLTGEFQLNSPDVDPSRGLTNLPTDVADVSNQIAQTCSTSGGNVAQNEFIVTGRGGLPDNPDDTLSSDAVWTDLRNPSAVSTHRDEKPVAARVATPQPPLLEANGWVMNEKGDVVLTASAPTITPLSPRPMPSQCHVSQTSRQ